MKKFDKKALAEVYSLIELLDEESYEKIPESLINNIKKNMDNDYVVDIDNLLNGEYLQETKDILCAIYTKYLATEEEQNVILGYAASLKRRQELMQMQYDLPQNIFGNKNQEVKYEEENVEVISNKEDNRVGYALEKVKKLFKK